LPIGEPRLLALLWLLTIFTLSSYPFLSPPGEISGRDKLAHLVVYGILGHLLGNVAWENPGNRRARRFAALVVFGFFWGMFDELYQGLVPGRFVSALDLTADTIGVAIGVLTSWKAAVRGSREESTS
jgi:VanZ family protein